MMSGSKMTQRIHEEAIAAIVKGGIEKETAIDRR